MALNSNQAVASGAIIIAGLLAAAANVGAFSGFDANAVPAASDMAVAPADQGLALPTVVNQDDIQVVVDPSSLSGGRSEASPTTTYRIGDAGSVTVTVADGIVAVTDLSPALGWTAASPDDGVASSAYAVFTDTTVVIEFRVVNSSDSLVPTINALAAD